MSQSEILVDSKGKIGRGEKRDDIRKEKNKIGVDIDIQGESYDRGLRAS